MLPLIYPESCGSIGPHFHFSFDYTYMALLYFTTILYFLFPLSPVARSLWYIFFFCQLISTHTNMCGNSCKCNFFSCPLHLKSSMSCHVSWLHVLYIKPASALTGIRTNQTRVTLSSVWLEQRTVFLVDVARSSLTILLNETVHSWICTYFNIF